MPQPIVDVSLPMIHLGFDMPVDTAKKLIAVMQELPELKPWAQASKPGLTKYGIEIPNGNSSDSKNNP
jgi:hypothetical protein